MLVDNLVAKLLELSVYKSADKSITKSWKLLIDLLTNGNSFHEGHANYLQTLEAFSSTPTPTFSSRMFTQIGRIS
jgi:hypothetical protein